MRKSTRNYVLALTIVLLGIGTIAASNFQAATDDFTVGAQLYDRWYAVLGVNAPAGNMPIWERQSTNTRSGPDTWRCSECHGWDYKGSEGAYSTGSHFTGFPNVLKLAAGMSETEIVAHLKGSKDPSHDFSKYIDDANLEKLAKFLKEAAPDDSASVDDVTHKAIGGNLDNGKKLFGTTCTQCHGADGTKIVITSEGVNEYIGTIANRDPYRFLHRTRFGVAGTNMPVGHTLGWKTPDSVDVLTYAQSLPTGTESTPVANAGASSQTSPKLGGPQSGVLGGLLTGITTVFGMLGLNLLLLLGVMVIGVLLIWAFRRRK